MKRLISYLPIILLLLLSGGVLLGSQAGYSARPVLSGSMEPTIHTGSVVILKEIPTSEVKAKESIIAFYPNGGKTGIVHRVDTLKKTAEGIVVTTKGDNNKTPDPEPFIFKTPTVQAVQGSIPYLGRVSVFLKTTNGMIFLGSIFVLFLIYLFWPSGGSSKNDDNKPLSENSDD